MYFYLQQSFKEACCFLFVSEEIKELVQIYKVSKGQQGCQELLGKYCPLRLPGLGVIIHINSNVTETPRVL